MFVVSVCWNKKASVFVGTRTSARGTGSINVGNRAQMTRTLQRQHYSRLDINKQFVVRGWWVHIGIL